MFNKKTKKNEEAINALTTEVERLRSELEAHGKTAGETSAAADGLSERLSRIEATVTGLGSELSRQLHELGSDIETLTQKVDDDSALQIIESVKSAQVRLANEQARYEIAFRQDLAALAESLKRGK
jgi:chromosome segregation ATPase